MINKLKNIVYKEIENRYGFNANSANLTDEQKEIVSRIEWELKIIEEKNGTEFYLKLIDIANYANENNIEFTFKQINYANTLTAYLTGITLINPIKYGLISEIYLLNKEDSIDEYLRIFELSKEPKLKEYIEGKYGEKFVSNYYKAECGSQETKVINELKKI